MTLTKDEQKELDDRNQRNALNKEIVFQLYRLSGLTTSKILQHLTKMSESDSRLERFNPKTAKTFTKHAIDRFKNAKDEPCDVRVRYFELPVKQETAPVEPLRLLVFFDTKSKSQIKIRKLKTMPSSEHIMDGIVEFRNELKYPLDSLHITQNLLPNYDYFIQNGISVRVSLENLPENGIVVEMTLKNGNKTNLIPFDNAEARDKFYKNIEKIINSYNASNSNKVRNIREKFNPTKDNFTQQKLKESQRIFECPERILNSIYEYFKGSFHGKEIQEYLDGLSFKKDVNVINVHDMNIIKMELCQRFDSSIASSFINAIVDGISCGNLDCEEYEFALDNLNKIIELDQVNAKNYYKYKAMIHDDLKNYQVALRNYEKSIELFPSEAKREKIKSYARMFRINFCLENYEDSIECCKKAMDLNRSRNANHNDKVPLIEEELNYYFCLAILCISIKSKNKEKYKEIIEELGVVYKIIADTAELVEIIMNGYKYNDYHSPLTRIEKAHVIIKAYEIAIDFAIEDTDYEFVKKYTDKKNELKHKWGDMRAFI